MVTVLLATKLYTVPNCYGYIWPQLQFATATFGHSYNLNGYIWPQLQFTILQLVKLQFANVHFANLQGAIATIVK